MPRLQSFPLIRIPTIISTQFLQTVLAQLNSTKMAKIAKIGKIAKRKNPYNAFLA